MDCTALILIFAALPAQIFKETAWEEPSMEGLNYIREMALFACG